MYTNRLLLSSHLAQDSARTFTCLSDGVVLVDVNIYLPTYLNIKHKWSPVPPLRPNKQKPYNLVADSESVTRPEHGHRTGSTPSRDPQASFLTPMNGLYKCEGSSRSAFRPPLISLLSSAHHVGCCSLQERHQTPHQCCPAHGMPLPWVSDRRHAQPYTCSPTDKKVCDSSGESTCREGVCFRGTSRAVSP